MYNKVSIKKKDKVIVLVGKDKGKTGTVLEINLKKERARVEGVNLMKKHVKPNPQTGAQGGIEELEAPIHISNLQVICPECGKPTRVGKKFLEDGKKVRVCKKCSGLLDK
jgi:large subunit ribosomal protein L24